ncbi:MAG: bifunctional DNA primase/polymerase [Sphingomonadaceae bacterium]|nr:bifunctional DNA primase/polymerase [Sphingomonadaceae bacterium]
MKVEPCWPENEVRLRREKRPAGLADLLGHLGDEVVRLNGALAGMSGPDNSPVRRAQPSYMKMYGPSLIEQNFDIVPVRPKSKVPVNNHWQELKHLPRTKLLRLVQRHPRCSIGLNTSMTPAFDIDCDHQGVVEQLRSEILAQYNAPPERQGRGQRTAFCFRTDQSFKKERSSLWLDQGGREQKVEFLCSGQQIVIYGYHPDTLLPYTWYRDGAPFGLTRITPDELPSISSIEAEAWCSRFDELALQQEWTLKSETKTTLDRRAARSGSQEKLSISLEDLRDAVMNVPDFDDYDRYIIVGIAIYNQTGGSEGGLELWNRWASQSAKFDPDVSKYKWSTFGGDDRASIVSARTIYFLAGMRLPVGTDIDRLGLSEDTVASAFALRHENDLRYDHYVSKWMNFDGNCWRLEETELAFDYCRRLCRELRQESTDEKTRRALSRASAVAAVEKLARADRNFAVTSSLWDQDSYLLGTPGGTVDLRTGKLRPASRLDYLTTCAAVAPIDHVALETDMPVFYQFLMEVTSGDRDLVRYLQKWGGYCLTGDTREQVMLFIHGPGGNGKSIFQGLLASILGEYSWSAPPEMFLASRHDRHPTELASLRGKRLVIASENESGRAWAEVRIKQLTGGDRVTARMMRQDFFSFQPVAKFFFVGNNKPSLTHIDDAMRRRIHVAEFQFKPSKPDKTLAERIRPEWPAILRWFIDGCLDWQRNGFDLPHVVRKATQEYFAEQDTVQEWIDDCCDIDPLRAESNQLLRDGFARYCQSRGQGREIDVLAELRRRNFQPFKNKHGIRGRGLIGLRIREGGILAG